MGFRDLALFNDSLLAKQAWQLMHRTDTLFFRIFKAWFFPQCSFMEAKNSASGHMLGKVYLKEDKLSKGVHAFRLAMVRRSESGNTIGSPLNI